MKVVRVNISVPEDVHAGMKNRPEVNWSAIATIAFRSVLRKDKDATDIVEELQNQIRQLQNKLNRIREALR